jgi:hypothetical protein
MHSTNWCFFTAGFLMTVIGLIHSLLGERLIFGRMRSGGLIPTNGGQVLREPYVRILWATWHVATAMAMGIAVVLFWLALPSSRPMGQSLAAVAIIGTMIVSSSLVLVATKGKHPGWAGMLCVAVLAAIGAYA